MFIIKIIFFFLTILTPGYLLLLFLEKERRDLLYDLAISYGLGIFFITAQIFTWIFLFKQKFNFYYFLIILFLELALLLYFSFKKNKFTKIKLPSFKMGLVESVVLLLVVIQIFFAISNSLARPVATYDSMAMWAFKSKVLYFGERIDFNQDSFLYLGGGGHINYPWLVPISQFWLHETLGEYNDLAINIIFVSFYICALIVLFYFLRNYLDRIKSLVFVFFLSSMPLFFYHSFNAYADLVLSFYLLLGFIYLCKWFAGLRNGELIVAGIFFGIAFWVKIEAIVYILASLPLIFIRAVSAKQRMKNIIYYIFALFFTTLPWMAFRVINKLEISNVESGFGFHPEILSSFFNVLFTSNSWNIWWYIFVVIFVINIKKIMKKPEIAMAWLFLFISVLGFLVLYLFTEQYQFSINGTALSRNILTFIPISVAVAGLSFSKINIKNNI